MASRFFDLEPYFHHRPYDPVRHPQQLHAHLQLLQLEDQLPYPGY